MKKTRLFLAVLIASSFVFSNAKSMTFDHQAEFGAGSENYVSTYWDGYPCGRGIRSDSYGRGIEAGFRGQFLLPIEHDMQCYKFGLEKGKKLDNNDKFCKNDFEDGYIEGWLSSPDSAGYECYVAAYSAGSSARAVALRENWPYFLGLVKLTSKQYEDCKEAYADGKEAYNKNEPPTTSLDNLENSCYMRGYYDAGVVD